ncbi:MAG: hypothetical protein DRO73_09330 [Candidatus Thorarchaeota archaeon]|nr:MAG: hypothetical protein DRO73_09330 [Candidatus Thorarchaeota archaeon]RLI55836.1 MAG: hypothetical protein DRO93_11660 [Candidatus Thorarchaeota archaeon]
MGALPPLFLKACWAQQVSGPVRQSSGNEIFANWTIVELQEFDFLMPSPTSYKLGIAVYLLMYLVALALFTIEVF